MRVKLVMMAAAVFLAGIAAAQSAQVDEADLVNLFRSLDAGGASEPPRYFQTPSGFIRFIGAPPGGVFAAGSPGAKASADAAAGDFLQAHAGAFSKRNERGGYVKTRVKSRADRTYVHFRQSYNGLQVFGSGTVVQVNSGGIMCVYSDVMRDSTLLDNGTVSLSPSIMQAEAKSAAIAAVSDAYDVNAGELSAELPDRYIYDPAVVGQEGPVTVAWRTVVTDTAGSKADVVLVDAHNRNILLRYPLIHDARNRLIRDANHNPDETQWEIVRAEGRPPCPLADANLAYDYLGDTYNFYAAIHDRDSMDDAGMTLEGVVRICFYGWCPVDNAYYDDTMKMMLFGDGYVVDDVVAHEYTHGVTAAESNLIYAYQSGALSESLSDMWGEFVDLTNGRGLDTAAVRWLIGEDLPIGAIRNMKKPPQFGDPDRMGSPNYYYGSADNGGVHRNCGVTNKLCYLVTDGDSFNGYDVEGIGIEAAAELFYEMQAYLLSESSDFEDFYYLLGQATVNQGYTLPERLNIQAAAKAVEIAPAVDPTALRTFRGIPTFDSYGRPVNAMMWKVPNSALFRQVILVRNVEHFPESPEDGIQLYRGRNEKFLDTAVVSGRTYFYTLYVDVSAGWPTSLNAKVTAGSTTPPFLTEYFYVNPYTGAPVNANDLSFSQITFYPTGAPRAGLGGSASHGDYSQYTASFRRNVFSFPVAREDTDGAAIALIFEDDSVHQLKLDTAFPFFGISRRTMYVGANGYISFEIPGLYSENFPSLASHFALPRISPLFADLDPLSGGLAWARELNDRFVITWEDVPEWGWAYNVPIISMNSFQVELFYSGQIRFTYLGVDASQAVAGISDGMGAPTDPAVLFPGVQSVDLTTDFSMLSTRASQIYIEPVPPITADAGELIENVRIRAVAPPGSPTPSLTAEWNGPVAGVPFVDLGDSTGLFQWQTTPEDYGNFILRVHATSGAQACYQDILLRVGHVIPLPEVLNIRIRSGNPVEDPTQSRVVESGTSLFLEYDYYHPDAAGDPMYEEGYTEIRWFKNNLQSSVYPNVRTIPAQAIAPGDTWYCTVTPYTYGGTRGMTQVSPVITVMALPRIFNVALPEDLPPWIDPGDLPIEGLPVASGPSTGGTRLVILGNRLLNPVSVKVGGIEASSIVYNTDWRLEVITPPHVPSPLANGVPIPEQVVVTTANGTGRYVDGFIYANGTGIELKADVNGDGEVNAVDVQMVVNAVLERNKTWMPGVDVNLDGAVNAADLQVVINEALLH